SKDIKDSEDVKDSENGDNSQNSEIYFQIKECDKIREEKFKNRSNKDKSKSFQTHPQAFYTSRLLNFKNLPKPVNSSDLSSFQFSSGNLPYLLCNFVIKTIYIINFISFSW